MKSQELPRRTFLQVGAAGLAATQLTRASSAAQTQAVSNPKQPTRFQIACMTLPYSRFPLQRALSGLRTAGYGYVAWGTTHLDQPGGKPVPVLASSATPAQARELA